MAEPAKKNSGGLRSSSLRSSSLRSSSLRSSSLSPSKGLQSSGGLQNKEDEIERRKNFGKTGGLGLSKGNLLSNQSSSLGVQGQAGEAGQAGAAGQDSSSLNYLRSEEDVAARNKIIQGRMQEDKKQMLGVQGDGAADALAQGQLTDPPTEGIVSEQLAINPEMAAENAAERKKIIAAGETPEMIAAFDKANPSRATIMAGTDADGITPAMPNLQKVAPAIKEFQDDPENIAARITADYNKIKQGGDPDELPKLVTDPYSQAGIESGSLTDPDYGSNLNQRKALRRRITEQVKANNIDGDGGVNDLREIGMTELGIGKKEMDREIMEERRNFVRGKSKEMIANRRERERKQLGSYEDFYKRMQDPNRTLGVGQRRSLYSRNAGLRKARMLRKKGFIAAANQAAADWAKSPESNAPAVASQQFLAARDASQARVADVRNKNAELQQMMADRLMNKMREDPNFLPNFQAGGGNRAIQQPAIVKQPAVTLDEQGTRDVMKTMEYRTPAIKIS